MSADVKGPWTFDRGRSTAKRKLGGPLFTSDIHDVETVARKRKRAEIEALPDTPARLGVDQGLISKIMNNCNLAKIRKDLGAKLANMPVGRNWVNPANLPDKNPISQSAAALIGAKLANMPHGGDRKSDQAANLPLEISQPAAALIGAKLANWPRGGDRPSKKDINFDSANLPDGISQPAAAEPAMLELLAEAKRKAGKK